MFLDTLVRRNPAFVRAAADLHQAGKIPASSFVLDLDAMEANAGVLAREAARHGLTVFGMTKQFGRSKEALDAVVRGGISSFVAVDLGCARAIVSAGHRVGHLGHLVQVPRSEAGAAAGLSPDYWTLFSLDKAQEASDASLRAGRRQKVLLRVRAEGDTFYHGHEGGFPLADLPQVLQAIQKMEGLEFAGFTSFPALLFNEQAGEVLPTPNLTTLARASRDPALKAFLGTAPVQVNAPGTTSSAVMEVLARAGATQVEPGHALTGTTPLHVLKDLPEVPALLYVSEVSHVHEGDLFFFGGGLYIDPVFRPYPVRALVGRSGDELLAQGRVDAELPPDSAIDYYGILHPQAQRKIRSGDSVVLGFRAQAFVTRATVAAVKGISTGRPEVVSVRNSEGRSLLWP